jgi:hypothetical protein
MKHGPIGANRHAAEEMAGEALLFLAGDAERLGTFLAQTGLDPRRIREAAGDPGFLIAVLDYLMENEGLLKAFANDANLAPEQVVRSRIALGGHPPQ